MNNIAIKNIVFDIGNVMVKWSPVDIIKNTFGESANVEAWLKHIFQNETWLELNRGELSEQQAMEIYLANSPITQDQARLLFKQVKETQSLLETHRLLPTLQKNYSLFALTDNIHETVRYLKQRYDFWDYFAGIVVSAEIGHIKPHPEIFQHLLKHYDLKVNETLFIDDVLPNVLGAQAVGLHAFQFIDLDDCKKQLQQFGIEI